MNIIDKIKKIMFKLNKKLFINCLAGDDFYSRFAF